MCRRSWSLQRGRLRSTFRSKALQEAKTQSNNVGVWDTGDFGLSHSFDTGIEIGRDLQAYGIHQPFEPVNEGLADSRTMLPAHEQTPNGRLVDWGGAENDPSELSSQSLRPVEIAPISTIGAGYDFESYFPSPEAQNDLAQAFQSPRYITKALTTIPR
uniref:Uncharacterized protein n=1 Tax=Rhodosorus marinus TaxID=101924 RepID=A0A6T6MB55_9RHOD|mmetsp:Transcript_23300/g.33420  ORF Transcript_23300/g.33420 Transcript_23300/m.33420 type:complete len:158 (+) Transcript_23300:889-1362(+)